MKSATTVVANVQPTAPIFQAVQHRNSPPNVQHIRAANNPPNRQPKTTANKIVRMLDLTSSEAIIVKNANKHVKIIIEVNITINIKS